jgi:hypothetical protein
MGSSIIGTSGTSASSTTASPFEAPAVAAPPPAAAGSYPLSQSGGIRVGSYYLALPSRGALVVGAPQSGGNQLWQYYGEAAGAPAGTGVPSLSQGLQELLQRIEGSVGLDSQPSYTKVQFRPSGPVVVSATEPTGSGNQPCSFDPPLPFPPWPPTAGEQAGTGGTCGASSVSISEVVTGTEDIAVTGTTYTTWILDITIKTTGQLASSGEQVDYYSPALRLPLQESSDIQGAYDGVSFALQSASALLSGRPD